ncbi:hypothetical protein A4X09_0g6771 [Tilletia walkeri]|uniref:Uncharacterized protein n=1 Tax=Tilletia walkeri TaxID=117179 RepID=A0A8X7T2S6_9BASI|nr:hypothetical protein A4X09_0g6771 [Tilletia walkeri]
MEARPLQPSPAAARHLAGDNTALDDLRGILLTNGERVVLVPMPSEWMTLCQLAAYTFSFDLRTHYPAFYLQLPHTSYHQQQLNEAEIPPLAFRSLKERDVVRVEVLARGGEERVVEGGNGEGEGMLGLLGAVEGVGEEEGMLGLVGALEGVGGDEERMLGLDRAVIGGDGDGEGLPGLDRAIEDLLNSGLARGEEGEEEDRRVENVERLSSSEESQMRRVHADGDGERRADDASQVQQVPISNVGGPEEGNSDNNKEDADLGKEVIVEIEAAPAQSMDTAMGTSADGSSTAATIATGDKEGEKDREGGDNNNRGDADRDRGKEVIVEIEVAPQQSMEATMSTSAQGSLATVATAGAATATGGNNEGEDGEKIQEDVDTNNKNITPPTQQNATGAAKKPRTRSSTGIKTATKKASASASVGTSARKSKRLMRKPATTTTTTGEVEQADQVPSVSMSSPSKKGIDGMPLGRPPAEAGKRRTYDEKRKLAVRSRSLKGKQALSGESSSAAAIGGGGGEVGLDSGKGFKSRADGTTRMMDGSGSGVVENSDDGEEEEVEMGLEGQV